MVLPLCKSRGCGGQQCFYLHQRVGQLLALALCVCQGLLHLAAPDIVQHIAQFSGSRRGSPFGAERYRVNVFEQDVASLQLPQRQRQPPQQLPAGLAVRDLLQAGFQPEQLLRAWQGLALKWRLGQLLQA